MPDSWRPIRGAGDRCLGWPDAMLLRIMATRRELWNRKTKDFDRRTNCVVYHQYVREAQRRGIF